MGNDEKTPHAGAVEQPTVHVAPAQHPHPALEPGAEAMASTATGASADAAASEPVLVYHLSDSTGVTAETLGTSLTAQFPGIRFRSRTIPFITTDTQAHAIVAEINAVVATGTRVLVLCTAINPTIRAILTTTTGTVVDLFTSHIHTLEHALGTTALYATGRAHGQGDLDIYQRRMKAIEYAIEHDDAQSLRNIEAADVILIGPSRCGKTPTSMYLALQHGIFVANYPLLDEDYDTPGLPAPLRGFEKLCVGITTTPLRLSQVRNERRPGSTYASLEQCSSEIRHAEILYRTQRIPTLSSATTSVEEMSAVILHTLHLPGINTEPGSTSRSPHPTQQR